MVIQDNTHLIVPSAISLAKNGGRHLDILIENINKAWAGSIRTEGPQPQSDYAVEFDWSAFTDVQIGKVGVLIESAFDT